MNVLKILSAVFVVFFGGLMLLNFPSCTHDNQNLNEFIPPEPVQNFSESELVSRHVTTPPTVDGVIDNLWNESKKLITRTEVPDPGDDRFKGYVGDAYDVTFRSVYDDENIYFLAEWNDQNKDLNRDTWYFDPGSKRWKEESNKPVFNQQGNMIRKAFYEDKLAMLWNVNNSVEGWNNATCYTSCHTDLGADMGFARHFTNGPNETIDMWHWKSVRSDPNNQFDDQFQDNKQPNGRHGDTKDGGGYTNNAQELTITGTNETVEVPKYFIPERTYYYWVLQDEIENGTAKLITAVDENGVLTYDGGTLDPNTDVAFQREGSTTGAKCIPSVFTEAFIGNRGDITGKGVYTGSGWIVEYKRKLKTGDTENQDVDFSDLTEKYFGIGIFNNAAIAHSIKPNLLLKFE